MHSNNQSIQEYWRNERKKYWPVSSELMAQYKDGTHTGKDGYGYLYWRNKNNQNHRDGDKPAVIRADGQLVWYQNGLYHRDGDKPAYIGRGGTLSWYQNGQKHRDGDKPAYIGADGTLVWYQNSLRHRFRGPAVINSDGTLEWYWRGEYIPVDSQEEFVQYLTLHNLTEGETMKPKMITARDAYAIYEAAKKEKNLKLWETHAPELDRLIRERSENGLYFVHLEYETWKPMVDFIKDLGYNVHLVTTNCLDVDWSKS